MSPDSVKRRIAPEEDGVEDAVEFSGRTVEDAVGQAEGQLGVPRGELTFEVITSGSRGVFGIGAELARIRVARQASSETSQVSSPLPEAPAGPTTPSRASSAVAVSEEQEHVSDALPQADGVADLATSASEVLHRLLDSMGFDAQVSVRSHEDPVMLAITGENLGVLIGRRGDNLAALQFVVNLILSKNRRQWPRIVVDVENYRARREESLRTLAERIAYRVRRNQRPFTLEAMPASDRRIIHLSLRDEDDLETYSIGEGVARRVVIAPRRPVQVPASDL
jgi:spoIIIJ-associated protein